MNIIDISWPISPRMTSYKDKQVVAIEQTKVFERDTVRETLITLSSHTGTHIDAPAHFLKDGISIDTLHPLSCVGPAQVFDMTHVDECITKEDLNQVEITTDIVLFKTKNSFRSATEPFDYNFIYLAASGAEVMIEHNIRAIGIDYLGIERKQPGHETHKIFMQRTVPIIEGLRLQEVSAGTYFLWCLPLYLPGLEAAPARALLIKYA